MSELTPSQIREAVASFPADGIYFVTPKDKLPFRDFNREVYAPGDHPKAPDGVIGIRADDDFWSVANVPYSFKDTPLAIIIDTLWPDIGRYKLLPDSDMPQWYKENGFPEDEDA